MSLILDALRKSEIARRAGREPVYRDGAPMGQMPMLRGLSVAAGLVLLAALVISIWILSRPDTTVPVHAKLAPADHGEGANSGSAPPNVARTNISLDSADDTRSSPFAVAAGSAAQPTRETNPPARKIPQVNGNPATAPWLSAMPDGFRASLPKLVITIHVYAQEEGKRILYINNRPLKRGDDIEGVVVEDIVPEGAVLRAHGQRFRIPRPS